MDDGHPLPGVLHAENVALRASIKDLTEQIRELELLNTEHEHQAGRWLPALLDAIEVLEETTRVTDPYRWGFGQHDEDLDRVYESSTAALRRLRGVLDPTTDATLVDA